jgi:flagellar M-ring protein FliF
MLEQRQYVKMLEDDFERVILGFLTPIFGRGNVTAAVRARVNFDRISTRQREHTPSVDEDGMRLSLQTILENARGLANYGGLVGTDPNGLGDEYAEVDDLLWNEYSKETETVNWIVNELLSTIEREPALLEQLSASISINADSLDEDMPQNVSAIQQLIAGALSGGLDLLPAQFINRIVVQYHPYKEIRDTEAQRTAFDDLQRRERMYELIQTLVLYGIIGICMLLIILRTFALLKPKVVEIPAEAFGGDMPDYSDMLEAASASMELEVTKTPSRERVEEFIEANPEAVASMLRTWLQDEEDSRW